MPAHIQLVEDAYLVKLERHLNHPVDDVWSWLTDNSKLAKWFPELRVEDLREGGFITFDMQNGHFEKMEITELRLHTVLEYTWAEDLVRFELYPDREGCRLIFTEKLKRITDHTPRDIAGWDVCLEAIAALLDGKELESRHQLWQAKYAEYVKEFNRLIT